MINLYSGTPGSGKSLHSATTIYWHLRRGLPVIANFPIALEAIPGKPPYERYFMELDNEHLTPELLLKISREYYSRHPFSEDGILLVIDECQLVFNAREWNAHGRAQWLSFFTQHRKMGYEVILVAQFDRMVDRQIRSLIEYQYVHRKVSNFGIMGKIMSLLSGGKLFVAVKLWYPLNEKVDSTFFRALPKYYRLYDTYAHFEGDEAYKA